MPAVASLEEFKAPQKDLYAMRHALCDLLMTYAWRLMIGYLRYVYLPKAKSLSVNNNYLS